MTGQHARLTDYFKRLSRTDRRELEERMHRHRERLEAEGYTVTIAEGENGLFAGVLVIDDEKGLFGFLEDDGRVTWLTGQNQGIGALGSAVAQNPTEKLDHEIEGLGDAEID